MSVSLGGLNVIPGALHLCTVKPRPFAVGSEVTYCLYINFFETPSISYWQFPATVNVLKDFSTEK